MSEGRLTGIENNLTEIRGDVRVLKTDLQ